MLSDNSSDSNGIQPDPDVYRLISDQKAIITTTRKLISMGGSRYIAMPPNFAQALGLDTTDEVELTLVVSPTSGEFVKITKK